MPFNPTDELTLRFTVTEINQIMAQLQEGPWKLVHPLITKINVQAAQQESQAAVPHTGDISVGYTNGEMQQPEPAPNLTDPLSTKPN